jgi:hypothetical protein
LKTIPALCVSIRSFGGNFIFRFFFKIYIYIYYFYLTL